METSPQASAPSVAKRLFDELVRGQGYGNQLKDILAAFGNNLGSEVEQTTRDLVDKVFSSIKNSLSMLSPDKFEEVSQVVVARRPMKRCKPNASEDSEGSVRSSLPPPRDRRGCYKRRSKGETWTEFTPSMTADDHQWRKYGQKTILNAAHPRDYFRCTHKFDQGCMATKQVQKISDDPIKFRTVYQGRHTCTDDRRLKSIELVSDKDGSNNLGNGGSPVLISFERNDTISAPLKNEETSEDVKNKGAVVPSASSDNNYFDIFAPSGDISIVSSDPGDVWSSGNQDSYLDMMLGRVDMTDFALDYCYAGDI